MIAIAFVICLKNRSFKSFFITIWMYLSVILSDYYSMKISKGFDRFMAGIWLLVCSVLLAAFSGQIWHLLVRAQPIDQIDSWDDLYSKPQWKEKNIITFKFLDMDDFINKDESPMALNFQKRVQYLDLYQFHLADNLKFRDNVNKRFLNGQLVGIFDYIFLNYLKVFQKNSFYPGLKEGFDFHISRFGAGMKPYFIVFTPRMKDSFKDELIRCEFKSNSLGQL